MSPGWVVPIRINPRKTVIKNLSAARRAQGMLKDERNDAVPINRVRTAAPVISFMLLILQLKAKREIMNSERRRAPAVDDLYIAAV